jgi:penicillin amidase
MTPARISSFCLAALVLVSGLLATGRASDTQPDRLRTLARESLSPIAGELGVPGLRAPVEVIRDRWGVPHIYAQNIDDLFMAQGYVMAQDRLWQMEMWRRQIEGRLAEILGQQAVARDRTARLLKYRGPMDDREWTSYHPEGKRIFTAYAAGVNAFIAARTNNLPVEFKITGIRPEPWTAETVVLRVASYGNASAELSLARDVVRLGPEQANKQRNPDPWEELAVPEGLDVSLIDQSVTTGRGGGGGIRPAIIEPYRSWMGGSSGGESDPIRDPGSNNWVISGKLSATGRPVVANDPHRSVGNPSLRYISHLVAPGWNVIGASEPPFVGVAIGHNDRLGWGLTIVGTDQEDVYVEELNPANPNEVRWQNGWEPLRIVREEITVKDAAPVVVELKYSRHGPIFHEDVARRRAYALRSALLEPGTAPYLGGLRLAQAKDCKQFLSEAMYWKSPSENLICGDVDGHISWQASALTPNRSKGKWSGRLPVPGDGRYEWDGFRGDLPRELNPPRGFIATANNNVQPKGFTPPIMFKSAGNVGFERIDRLLELIQPGRQYTIEDHRRMQVDALHIRARGELPLFRGWTASRPQVERARRMIAEWNAMLARDSAAAALHMTWRGIASGQERDASRPIAQRQPQHEVSLAAAIQELEKEQGADWSGWRWGRMHTRAFPHPLVAAFNLETVERGGGGGTVAADGASYREIFDVGDWDRSIVTNAPGQSAQPESPFYGNLLPLWADDTYFPLVYSRPRVDREAAHKLTLRPK